MKNLSDYRQAGRTDLSGRWAESAMLSFVACVAFSLVGGGGSILLSMWPFVSGLGNLFVLLLLPMSWGYNMAFLANHRRVSNDPFDITCLVEGYHDFWRIFSTYFLIVLYIFLWSLLLVIPGIIKSLSYSMTPYILKDRPDLSREAAIEMSMAMMSGRKMDLFLLQLSFIGWGILCIFTLGIGYFWLAPYMNSTYADFYEDVKSDFENGGFRTSSPTSDNYQR